MGGWCDPKKASDLADLVINTKAKSIADVGVFEGKSTLALAYACKLIGSGVVYGVDSWKKEDCIDDETQANKDWWSTLDLNAHYESFLRHVVRAEVGRHINVCRMTSWDASRMLPNMDLIHIDANHAEWPSTSDVVNWLPKLKIGGYIVMDDVNWASTQTAIRFVEKYCKLISKNELSESHYSIYQKLK